jgi:hypothetical protein
VMNRSVRRFAAVATSAGMAVGLSTFTLLIAPAGAESPPSVAFAPVTSGITAAVTPDVTLPNSNILGSPARFSPASMTPKPAKLTGSACNSAQASATITNQEKTYQAVVVTGNHHFTGQYGVIPAKTEVDVCVAKGYHGTVHVTLADGKQLTMNF